MNAWVNVKNGFFILTSFKTRHVSGGGKVSGKTKHMAVGSDVRDHTFIYNFNQVPIFYCLNSASHTDPCFFSKVVNNVDHKRPRAR